MLWVLFSWKISLSSFWKQNLHVVWFLIHVYIGPVLRWPEHNEHVINSSISRRLAPVGCSVILNFLLVAFSSEEVCDVPRCFPDSWYDGLEQVAFCRVGTIVRCDWDCWYLRRGWIPWGWSSWFCPLQHLFSVSGLFGSWCLEKGLSRSYDLYGIHHMFG